MKSSTYTSSSSGGPSVPRDGGALAAPFRKDPNGLKPTAIDYTVKWIGADDVSLKALFSGMKIGEMRLAKKPDSEIKTSLQEDFRMMRDGFDNARDLPLYVVRSIELDPEFQGKGIGYQMYREAFKFLAKNGGAWVCPDGHLKSGQSSKDALKVWQYLSERFDGNDYFLIVRPNDSVAVTAALLDADASRIESVTPDISYWMTEGCGYFALALNKRFGYAIEILIDDGTEYVDGVPTVAHVICVTKGGVAVDATGLHSRADVKASYHDLEAPRFVRVSPEELKRDWMVSDDKPLQDFTENEFVEASNVIALDPLRYQEQTAASLLDALAQRIEAARDSAFRGEWWLDDTGASLYADIDSGDFGHEAYAYCYALGLPMAPDESYDGPPFEIGQKLTPELAAWCDGNGASHEAIQFFSGTGDSGRQTPDARDYAIKHMGWIRAVSGNFQMKTFDANALRRIRNFEGFDDGTEASRLDAQVIIEDSTGYWEFSLADLLDDSKSIDRLKKQYRQDTMAMSAASPSLRKLVKAVENALTDDLRRAPWKGSPNAKAGHCYVACEALSHLTGGQFKPYFIQHEGAPHWFLKGPTGTVLDPTFEQFKSKVPYREGKGKGFLTKQPSKRAQIVIDRVKAELGIS